MNMSVDYAAIGQRIKGRRREQKRTQEWLAEQLQVSVGYISQIERGVTKVNLDTLSEIGASLGCDLGELVTGVAASSPLYLDREVAQTLQKNECPPKKHAHGDGGPDFELLKRVMAHEKTPPRACIGARGRFHHGLSRALPAACA